MKIGLIGGAGRTGMRIRQYIQTLETIEHVFILQHKTEIKPFSNEIIVDNIAALVEKSDVIIDFSAPSRYIKDKKFTTSNFDIKKPLIIGSTGLNKYEDDLRAYVKEIQQPVLYAPNITRSMTRFIQNLSNICNVLEGEKQFALSEFHHQHKKDNPSGTMLGMIKAMQESGYSISQQNIHGMRIGNVHPKHVLTIVGAHETIELTHTVLDPMLYPVEVVEAAYWIMTQKPGLYFVKDWVAENSLS